MPSPEKFKKSLERFEIFNDVVDEINNGYEEVVDKSPKKVRASYFKHAVDIMEEKLDQGIMQEVLEWNCCCKGGAREKASKLFAKENSQISIEEKLERIKNVPYMGVPKKNSDGTITVNAVSFFDGEKFLCACSNFNGVKRDYSVSKSYCYCCAGHFKYHYEIMLGVKLRTLEIVSSPLDSNGTKSCVIKYEIIM